MRNRRRAAAVALPIAIAALLPSAAVAAPSPDAVVAEVYGGGGNAGATLTTDFIELGTRGAAAVDVSGWSVQYLPASASATSAWQVTPLTGAVQPGDGYLIAEARGAGGTTDLPTPDVTDTIAMSATAGTVALVTTAEPLTCKTAADCAADTRIRDLVGYGSAVVREANPAPAASNTTSVARGAALADTDDNAVDFVAGEPTPPGTGEPPPVARPAWIHEIQGTTRLSPLAGEEVIVPGVVTAVRAFGSARGFWFSDPEPDADPRTSEGLFVFTGSATPAVAVGDAVLVTGDVAEFRPLAAGEAPATTSNQSITQLTGAEWTITSSGNPVPAAQTLTPTTVPTGYVPSAGGASIEALPLQPTVYALDFYESREGMPLRVVDARVVGPTDAFNALWVTSKPAQNATSRGGTLYRSYADPNSGRLKIESLIPFSERLFPTANVGDRLAGITEGPLDYSRFGGYVLEATTLGALVDGGTRPEVTRRQKAGELAVATYNVENLAPTNPQSKFDRLAAGIVQNLARPDIVALEEIQDDNGATNDAVVSADETLRLFTDAIVRAGGPRYRWRQIDPVDDADGGEPGGNIRVAFLFNPDRVTFVDRPGGDATTAVRVQRLLLFPVLSISPGRIDPANPAFASSRKPLAGQFLFRGRSVIVVANHFNSKGGDQALHGRFQPPERGSEVQRRAQATAVRAFVDAVRRVNRDASVVVLGDINDYQFSPTTQILTAGGALRTLIDQLPPGEQYTYVFDGNSQVLDQTLVTPGVRDVDYDVVHINAEFHDQASDHDPQIARFAPRFGVGGG